MIRESEISTSVIERAIPLIDGTMLFNSSIPSTSGTTTPHINSHYHTTRAKSEFGRTDLP